MGCDQVEVITPDTSFKENVVVRAELLAGENFTGVSFTKTLPLNIAYSISDAELKDVTVYLKINNTQVVPLHYTNNGLYKPLYNLKIKYGTVYELFAVYNDKSIYSKTRVPAELNITNVIYRDEYFLQGKVIANKEEAFGAAWVIPSQFNVPSIIADDFYSIVTSLDNISINKITVRTKIIPEQFRSNAQKLLTQIKVYAFDKAYLDYFNTKSNGKSVEDAFVHGGNNIAWNVEGENAIGLFIGSAQSPLVPHL
ncbi:MAG: DUF4249 family protein [Bacteroidetes bacterium]|nr:DUF4249 family protein [Bacteroidota bacterium]MCH8170897.1 DUF4249 family protein [Bacteroidota bacterium]